MMGKLIIGGHIHMTKQLAKVTEPQTSRSYTLNNYCNTVHK
jgi:hypothetical protein